MVLYLPLVILAGTFLLIENVATQDVNIGCGEQSQHANKGSEFVFKCFLENITPTNAVIVELNGEEVTSTLEIKPNQEVTNGRYTITTSNLMERNNGLAIWYRLKIPNIMHQDVGQYEFKLLTNSSMNSGTLTSHKLSFDVYYIPDGQPMCSAEEVTVDSGNNVSLTCSFPLGNPSSSPILLQWKDQGNVLPDTSTSIVNGTVTSNITVMLVSTESVTCTAVFDNNTFPAESPRSCEFEPIKVTTDPMLLSSSTTSPGEEQTEQISTSISPNPVITSQSLPLSTIIGISVGIVVLVIIVIVVVVLILLKSNRHKQVSSDQELHSTSTKIKKQSGPVICADLDLTDKPAESKIRPSTEEPQKRVSSDQELQPTSTKTKEQSGPVIYADLNLTDIPTGSEIRPLTEEPTVYASITPQKAKNTQT